MPTQDLSVLVLDEDRVRGAIIREGLIEAGHRRVAVVAETLGLAHRIEEINPDVIVIDIRNPNRDHVEHLFQLSRAAQRPVAMFVDQSDAGMMEAAICAVRARMTNVPCKTPRCSGASRRPRADGERLSILAGRPGADRPDPGALVCACFNIGVNQIRDAIRSGRAQSVDAVGDMLKAGTNCGSCRVEIGRMIADDQALPRESRASREMETPLRVRS